jgi:hypothetical protein
MPKFMWKISGWITLVIGVVAFFTGQFIPGLFAIFAGGYVLYDFADK